MSELTKFEWFSLVVASVGVIGGMVALYHLAAQV